MIESIQNQNGNKIWNTVLRVKSTNELLIPYHPYVFIVYHDKITEEWYIKLYKIHTDDVCCGTRNLMHIKTDHPVRSYRFDELMMLSYDNSDGPWRAQTEHPIVPEDIEDHCTSQPDTLLLYGYEFSKKITQNKGDHHE